MCGVLSAAEKLFYRHICCISKLMPEQFRTFWSVYLAKKKSVGRAKKSTFVRKLYSFCKFHKMIHVATNSKTMIFFTKFVDLFWQFLQPKIAEMAVILLIFLELHNYIYIKILSYFFHTILNVIESYKKRKNWFWSKEINERFDECVFFYIKRPNSQ